MKRLFLVLLGFLMSVGMAFAAVDINSADEKGLDAIKGVGPVKAKAIIDERKKNGPFKSLDDVATRVSGIGEKTVADWKKDGSVTVSGGITPVKADTKKDAPKAAASTPAPAPAPAAAASAAPKPVAAAPAPAMAAKSDEKKDAPKADAKPDPKKEAADRKAAEKKAKEEKAAADKKAKEDKKAADKKAKEDAKKAKDDAKKAKDAPKSDDKKDSKDAPKADAKK